MKKVSVIGHFGVGYEYLDGQTIKTKIVTNELCKLYGDENVLQLDTHGGIKTLLKSPMYVFKALKSSDNVIIFPAHNGLRIFGRLLPAFKKFFKNKKIHYAVIGGWLPTLLKTKKGLARSLKTFDGIYVETSTMKAALEAQGFENVTVMPNCKKLTVLSENELVYPSDMPYKLCTFSRVSKKKGIEDAVNAISEINEKLGYTAYTLDIYGQVDSDQVEWFETFKSSLPSFVKYGGVVQFDKSVEVLKDYFALLFPTHYFTEGIPGTILDAYAAGVPVISAKWESYADIVDDGMTGIGYSFDDRGKFKEILLGVALDPKRILDLKINCLKKANDYTPEAVIKILTEKMNA